MSTPAFAEYRRTSLAELRPYVPGEDLAHVSVGANCTAAGGPVAGDWIARDPYNHADQWIVLASYFDEHFTRATYGMRKAERLAELAGSTRAKLAERIVELERHSRNLSRNLRVRAMSPAAGIDQILKRTPDHEPEA